MAGRDLKGMSLGILAFHLNDVEDLTGMDKDPAGAIVAGVVQRPGSQRWSTGHRHHSRSTVATEVSADGLAGIASAEERLELALQRQVPLGHGEDVGRTEIMSEYAGQQMSNPTSLR